MRRWAVLIAAVLSACSDRPVVIDGSSPENFARTAQDARRDLPVGDRLAFDRAMRHPPGKRMADREEEAANIARQTYNGMTATEVVEIGRR